MTTNQLLERRFVLNNLKAVIHIEKLRRHGRHGRRRNFIRIECAYFVFFSQVFGIDLFINSILAHQLLFWKSTSGSFGKSRYAHIMVTNTQIFKIRTAYIQDR